MALGALLGIVAVVAGALGSAPWTAGQSPPLLALGASAVVSVIAVLGSAYCWGEFEESSRAAKVLRIAGTVLLVVIGLGVFAFHALAHVDDQSERVGTAAGLIAATPSALAALAGSPVRRVVVVVATGLVLVVWGVIVWTW